MRVADYIIERIYAEGAKHIFMVTGRGILFLSDAVARHKEIESICTHHEQSASFAAMAYSQYNEKIGACLVSTGCAATNAITGLLCAWQDEVPCIFISGQNKLAETTRYTKSSARTLGQQETDIVKIVEPLTKYAVMITDPLSIAYEIDKAFYLMQEGKKGPVWIDVPLDIQNMQIDPDTLRRFTSEALVTFEKSIIEQPKRLSGIVTKKGEYNKDNRVDLYDLSECLSEVLPNNSVLITDSGLIELILPSTIRFKEKQRCIHPISQGCMGYAIPAAIGAYYSSEKPIVAVVGDGSIMMNLQELQTISYHKLPITIFVVNNNMYSIIRNRQNFLFRTRTIGTDASNGVSAPDFQHVAECFDLLYDKIEGSSNLKRKVYSSIYGGLPMLCEIMGVENQEYRNLDDTRNRN